MESPLQGFGYADQSPGLPTSFPQSSLRASPLVRSPGFF